MSNFIFNEGAALALGAGLDWVGTDYEIAIYDNTVLPGLDSTWADLASGVVASQVIPARAVTTFGAAAGGVVEFVGISPTLPDGRLEGFVIKRASDNLLVAHINEGFDGLVRANPLTQPQFGDIFGVRADTMTYSVRLTPGANNENAWFRL